MTNHSIDQVLSDTERYWIEAHVPAKVVKEMKAELEIHLREALQEGKSLEDVVGAALADFAQSWAVAQRGSASVPDWKEVVDKPQRSAVGLSVIALISVAVVVAALLFGPKEETVDIETWRWIWVGAAVVLGIAEMLTAGFFMLPFAIGAAAAAVLAFFNVAVPLQLVVFITVSILALWGMQRFFRKQEEEQPMVVGATRYQGREATVLDDIDRRAATGGVRMGTEIWRATTSGSDVIVAGTQVRVLAVEGTRLVVEPLDKLEAE